MTGHLARLAARATAPASGGLRPRLPSLFEQPAGLRPGDPRVAPVAADAPDDAGRADAATGAYGAQRVPPGRTTGATVTRPGPAGSDATGAGLSGADVPGADVPGADVPGAGLPGAGARGGGVPGVRSPGTGLTGTDARRIGRADDRRLAPGTQAAAVPQPLSRTRGPARALAGDGQAGARHGDTDTAAGAPGDGATARPASGDPTDTSSRRAGMPEQVVASLVSEALADGLRTAADRDATTYDGTATRRDGVPPAGSAGLDAAPLPRLRTGASTEAGRRDRRPAAPEVTVNIGRIEVVPPPPEPPPAAPRPRPRARAAGAPALADYLRDRSRR